MSTGQCDACLARDDPTNEKQLYLETRCLFSHVGRISEKALIVLEDEMVSPQAMWVIAMPQTS